MRPTALLGLTFAITPAFASAGDSEGAAVARQKQVAEANCRTVQLAPLGTAETANFLVYGGVPEARLKGLAANLERQFSTACKALQFEKDEKPWIGKLTVYVFTDRGQFRSFVRQVEKRSPDEGEQSSVNATGETPHVAVAPGQSKESGSPETQAGYDVAVAVMTARSQGTPLPEWLTQGFARATVARTANMPASVRKRAARQLAGRIKPSEVWDDRLAIEQRLPLAVSVTDYLFYGKGLSRPGDFLLALRPSDEKPMKTAADALEAVKLTPEKFEAGYLAWLRTNN